MNRRGVILCFHPVVNGLCSALLNDFNLAGSVGTTLEDSLVVLHNNTRPRGPRNEPASTARFVLPCTTLQQVSAVT